MINFLVKTAPKTNFLIFCVIIFFLRLPPFYLLPFGGALFNSHSFARYLLIFLSIVFALKIYKKRTQIIIDRQLLLLILFYFITQSFSIIGATNLEEFFLMYKNIIFSLLIFFVAVVVLDSEEKIRQLIKVLLVTIIIDVFFQYIIYFQYYFAFSFIKPFLYEKYWQVLELNLRRQRFFVDIYDGALIPLLFYYLYTQRETVKKVISMFVISMISFFALVSNFRTQLLMVLFSLFFSLFAVFRKSKIFILQLVVIIIFSYIGYKISVNIVGYNTLDRLILPEKEEYLTITNRFDWWTKSIEMGLSSPFFGVGLGNFYDNLPRSFKKDIKSSPLDRRVDLMKITMIHPHSIFFGVLAETGFLGLLSLILLIGYFLRNDILLLKKSLPLANLLIISFWILFMFAVLNPPITLPYLSLFWLIRAMIIKSE